MAPEAGKEGGRRQLLSLPSWVRGRGEGVSALFLKPVDDSYFNSVMLMLFAIV